MMKSCSKRAIYDALAVVKYSVTRTSGGKLKELLNRKTIERPSLHLSTSRQSLSSQKFKPRRKPMENKYVQDEEFKDYKIFPWATSGLESAIVVNGPGKKDRIVFDMGYPHKETFNCSDVFIRYVFFKV